MPRKWFHLFCFATLAFLLASCSARPVNAPSGRSPTLPVTQPAPTDTLSPSLPSETASPLPTKPSESPTIPQATETPVPLPADTETPIPPPPATETPLPQPTVEIGGPALEHIPSGKPVTITLVRMLDASNGWAIGNAGQGSDHVLNTADGGQTWRDVTPAEPAPKDDSLVALGYFTDSKNAWVIYHSQSDFVIPTVAFVWRTQDGGQTWQPSSPLDLQGLNELYWPSDLTFAGPQNGWLLVHVGAGMSHDYVVLYRTQDGGRTWTRLLDPYNDGGIQGCQKTGLAFPTDQTGWLTGNCNGVMAGAFLFQTLDGGQTWQPVALPAPADTPGLFAENASTYCGTEAPIFLSPQAGKLIVHCKDTIKSPPADLYYLYATGDGGATWTSAYIMSGAIAFVSVDNGWAFGRNIFSTADDGKTWVFVKEVNWDGQFSFVSDTLGWAVARAESSTGTAIAFVQTTDGGKNWTIIHPVIGP